VTALCLVEIAAWAQDDRRPGSKGQDRRVREGGYSAPQGLPSISNATLKGINANGGIMLQDGEQTGVVATDRTTEIIIRGDADPSFVTPGSLVEVAGPMEGPRGPLSTNFVVVIRSQSKNPT